MPARAGRPIDRHRRTRLDSADIAQRLVDTLSDRQAEDITQIDISKVSTFADYFVIATAGNVRQMNALIDTLDREMKQAGVEMGSKEGDPESGWVLLDFEDVIVHLFSQEQREFYDLEGLWSRSAPLVRFQ
ncbi:MAG TPA: ribosome silencing factor [Dehalococcoidia bacterium]